MAGWSGDLRVRPGSLVFAGAPGSAVSHRHAAHQLVLMREGTVTLTGADGGGVAAGAALIPSGAEHAIGSDPSAVGIVAFADAGTTVGRGLLARFSGDPADPNAWIDAARPVQGLASGEDPWEVAALALAVLAGEPDRRREPSPALDRAVALLPELLAGPVRLGDLAAEIGMSADGLGRLFRTTFGMTFPTYVRWARLSRAAEAVLAGATITDAAHQAGFADGAHANRVCWEMFGISPLDATRDLGRS
jgi:AraC-like DNA-binding protein